MSIDITDSTVTISLESDPSTSVSVLLHGANILSWKIGGVEKLWLSEYGYSMQLKIFRFQIEAPFTDAKFYLSRKAILDSSKAVRGGIPLVFPVSIYFYLWLL